MRNITPKPSENQTLPSNSHQNQSIANQVSWRMFPIPSNRNYLEKLEMEGANPRTLPRPSSITTHHLRVANILKQKDESIGNPLASLPRPESRWWASPWLVQLRGGFAWKMWLTPCYNLSMYLSTWVSAWYFNVPSQKIPLLVSIEIMIIIPVRMENRWK